MKRLFLPLLALCQFVSPTGAEEAVPPPNDAGQVLDRIHEGRTVGLIGRGHRIRFEGNKIFTDDELRTELARSSAFQLAARPAESLKAFLETLGERLTSGYRNSGCPDSKVEVAYQPGNVDQPIFVRVEEGERFRQGEIIVRGIEGTDRQALIVALSREKEWTPEQRMLKRVRDAIESESAKLPEPVGGGIEPLEPWNDEGDASWKPGEPVAFKEPGKQPLALDVQHHLATQGRALARFKTFHERRPDGLADLVIDVSDPGPDPIIGQIIIDGAKQFEREEILKIVGLENGQSVRPRDLDNALLGLWRSGRVFPFDIDAHPRGPDRAEIDFRIRLHEVDGVPSLDVPASPAQKAVNKCIDWINRQMDSDEVLISFDEPIRDGVKMAIGWSTADGLLLDLQDPEHGQGVVLHYSNRGLDVLIRDGDQRMGGTLPVQLEKSKIRILPTGGEKPLTFSVAAAIGLPDKNDARGVDIGLLLTPAISLLKKDEFVQEDDRVVFEKAGLTLDLDSGMPVELAGGSILIGEGCVKERVEQFRRDVALAKNLGAEAVGWHGAMSNVLIRMVPEEPVEGLAEAMDGADSGVFRDLALMADLLGGPKGIGAFHELIEVLESDDDSEAFDIPSKLDEFLRAGLAFMAFRMGVLAVVEEVVPEADWPTVFSRELMLLLFSEDADARKNLTAVLDDASVGPVACVIGAKLLKGREPGLSQEFLRKARDQGSVEGFRSDWRMLVSTRSLLKKQMAELWESLRSLTPEKEAELAKILGERSEPILEDLLETLRQDGADPPTEELLAPTMDRLWEEHLEAWMEDYLDERIISPADPKKVAATINGVPVPRSLVRLLREQRRGDLKAMPLPEAGEAEAWTQDPALAAAVRATVLLEDLRKQGKLPGDEVAEGFIERFFPELVGKPDPDWVAATGRTRDQMRHWILVNGMVGGLMQSFGDGLDKQPDDEALLAHFDAHEVLFQSRLSTELVFVQPTTANPREWANCHRLAEAIAAIGGDGLTLKMVGGLSDHDDEAGFRVFSRVEETLDMFQVDLLEAIEDLEPGQASSSFNLGDGVAAVRLEARKRDKDIGLADVEDIVRDHWRAQELRRRAQAWFGGREAKLEIKVLENPEPRDERVLSPVEKLYLEKPESLLAQFLNAWENLKSRNEVDRNAALAWIFAIEGEKPLMEVLFEAGDHAMIRACLKRAVEADREKADKLILKLADVHADHGPPCTIHEYLTQRREELLGKAGAPAE